MQKVIVTMVILTQSQTNKTKVLKSKAAQCIWSAIILKLMKPKVENPNMYKMKGNSCNEITSSLPCWIKTSMYKCMKVKLLCLDI